jgi:REP element-mobilizing transposase RayT
VANSNHPPGNANLRIGRPRPRPQPQPEPQPNPHTNTANAEIGVPGEWHSRGYLPHFDNPQATQHVTFHLADSLPQTVLQRLDDETKSLPISAQAVERRKRIEAWIDAGHGSCILREPAIAAMVQNSLLTFDSQRYRLLAWVVMPNHVHVLFEPLENWTVAKIVTSWKKFAASNIRSTKGGMGPIWHREYWDRFIRDQAHLVRAIEYIQQNPVKAGLAAKPEDWPWSSAHYPGNANLRIGRPQPKSQAEPQPNTANPEIGVPRENK